MSIIITEKEFTEDELKYPCLMWAEHFDKKQIILVTGQAYDGCYIGTNLNGVGHPTGYHANGWLESSLKPYYGQITIQSGMKEIY